MTFNDHRTALDHLKSLRDNASFLLVRAAAGQSWLQPALNRLLAPFNPFDARRYLDPYPIYDQARTEPIFYQRLTGTWIVTGYDEVDAVLRGPVSSDRRPITEFVDCYRGMRQDNIDLMLATMIMRDQPDHGRLRKLVNRAFSRRTIADLRPRIAELTAELIAELDSAPTGPDGTVDVMTGFADRLPVYVIAELLGIPREQRDELKQMSEIVSQFVDPLRGFDPETMDATIDRLRRLFEDLAEHRRVEPGPDLFSGLVNAEENGDRLSHQELIAMAMLLLIGGHETTSGTIGNSIVALARNPEFRAGLSSDPDHNHDAVEELLRYDTPVQATDRTVVSEFTVGGKTLPAGAVVLVVVGAANRDPRRFDRPNELLLDRADARSISFGRGPHHCIGAALARVETAAALTAFVNAFPTYELDEDGLRWRPSTTFRGPVTVPIRLNTADRRSAEPISTAVGSTPVGAGAGAA